jgi:manganese efflux pump family protein
MELAALTFWIATVAGGLYMMGVTLRSGSKQDPATGVGDTLESRLPAGVVFGHGSLALAGLALWAVHMSVDERATAWSAVVLLVLVAAGGGFMFMRWQADRRGDPEEVAAKKARLAEQQIPSLVVHLHGAFALLTFLAVLYVAFQTLD